MLFLKASMSNSSSSEIEPGSLEWTERELRRQVRGLLVEVEARENAADAARKEAEALEAARRSEAGPKAKRSSGTARLKRSSGSARTRRRTSGSVSRRSSGSTRARVSGTARAVRRPSAGGGAALWLGVGALAAGGLGLLLFLI